MWRRAAFTLRHFGGGSAVVFGAGHPLPECCPFDEHKFEDPSTGLGAIASAPNASCLNCVDDQALEEPTNWLPTRAPVVVGLKHFELISLDEILAAEQDCRDLLLFNQAAQTLGVYAEYAGGLDKVQVVFERAGVHNCKRAQAREDITTVVSVRQTIFGKVAEMGRSIPDR